MAAVTYGPEGSEIVKIGNTFYLGYMHDGMLLLWTIPNNDLSSVTDYVEGEDLDDYLRELGDSYLTATEDEYATNIVNGANIWKAGSIQDITSGDQREDVISNTWGGTVSFRGGTSATCGTTKLDDDFNIIYETLNI